MGQVLSRNRNNENKAWEEVVKELRYAVINKSKLFVSPGFSSLVLTSSATIQGDKPTTRTEFQAFKDALERRGVGSEHLGRLGLTNESVCCTLTIEQCHALEATFTAMEI
jgi:hypothetical protein